MLSSDQLTQIGEECACRQIRGLARAVTALYADALSSAGVTPPQFTLLVAAARFGDTGRARDLAEALDLDRTTLARDLALLERRGLVDRVRGEDRRERAIRVTAAGHEALVTAHAGWLDAQRTLRSALGDDLLAVLPSRLEHA